jgi:hypothetical protein
MKRPFVVLSLPRSRSAWLSRFLTYRDWACGHDQLRYARTLDDVKTWLSMENYGTCETAGAPFWRLLLKYAPDVRVVTVRRPVSEVVESVLKAGSDFERNNSERVLRHLDKKLDQIEARMPNVRSVKFADMDDEIVCAELFEYCLPYGHDHDWWSHAAGVNVQVNFAAVMRYAKANLPAMIKLASQARQTMLTDLATKPVDMHGVTIRQECIDDLIRDCEGLFRRHCLAVGEQPENWMNKNIPVMRKLYELGLLQIMIGRSNGKPFGYLMTMVCPSLEEQGRLSAHNALFYAAPEMPGLGLKLQRAALGALKEKGAGEAFMRAGIRGDGDRMDVLYRRLGAHDFGRVYRVELAA